MTNLLAQFRPRALLGALPIFIFLGLRQVIGVEPAILGGFSASVAVYVLNRGHAGPILGLSTLALAIGALATAAALWQGSEHLYFAGDPAWDIVMAFIAFATIAIRRPIAAPLIYEVIPALRTDLHPRHAAFYLINVLFGLLFLVHGAARTWLLVTEDSIERYIVLSRLIQWPTVAAMLLLTMWLVQRAAGRAEVERAAAGRRMDG